VGYLKKLLSEVEQEAILDTLRGTDWVKREAAKQLGISRPTLYRKLKRYKIRSEHQEQLDKMLTRIQ
jgi:transcriptional regulator of acetoin/glycerol metabolism